MLLHPDAILALFFVNDRIFFFSKLITFEACSLRVLQNFFIQSSRRYKLCLFSTLSNDHIVHIENLQGIFSPIFVVEDFSFFWIVCISIYFIIKDSRSVWVMYGILSDFILWLNFNILPSSDGITVPQEILFLHTFSCSLNNVNHPYVLKLLFSIIHIIFLLEDNANLFLTLGIIWRIICFSQFELIFEI